MQLATVGSRKIGQCRSFTIAEYRVELSLGESIPVPAQEYKPEILAKSGRLKISIAVVLVAVMAGTVYWLWPSGAMEEPASVAPTP